ncbi:uncharacterized protein LOC120420166 [Culex pipiens pallens]|uniref:uncharacterized protein LOC120420166 n=1 Tax=Culex pipiens pallens TaxID=42434 RepID=UPI00195341EF|nr:uncharacterized protein LOC120420166 [Culex pipiens pallens]
MGTLSKHFYAATRDKTCRDMLHPGHTCWQAGQVYLWQGLIGAMRHYLPGAVTALLFRMNQWDDPRVWMNFVAQYARCIVAGLPMTAGSFHFFCGFYNLLGRFSAPFFVFIPSFLGACTCMFLPRPIVRAQGVGLLNMYVEFLIRRVRGRTAETLRTSRLIGTIVFGVFSAAMMGALQYLQIDRVWFANVYKESVTHNNNIEDCKTRYCSHHPTKPCWQHILIQVKRSFYFGLAICLIKNALPRITMLFSSPVSFLRAIASRFDYGLIGFFTGYKALFEIFNCCLPTNVSSITRSSIAGFFAGTSYYFFPNYLLFTYPITELMEVYWLVYMRSDLPKPAIARIIDRLPVVLLAYAFSLGMMYHLRVVYPYYTNRYCHKLMNIGTTGRSETLARGYAEIMLGYK